MYTDLINKGHESLLTRFGKFQPDTEKLIEKLLYNIKEKNEEDVSMEVNELAIHYQKECMFYLNRIDQMNEFEIEAFIWNIVMRLDIIRGIFPGMHSNDPLGLNYKLESFENEMWIKINQYFNV
jgi:hypothetical protein